MGSTTSALREERQPCRWWLRRSERIPDPRRWRDVIPPVLQELIADDDALVGHRELVGRCEQATAKLAEARAAHEQAVAKDEEAERAFAAGRRAKLAAPSAPAAEQAVEAAGRELALLERQLPKSADAVFAAAHPRLEKAAARLERQVDESDDEVEAAIGAALRLLDERAEASRQGHWIGLAIRSRSSANMAAASRRAGRAPPDLARPGRGRDPGRGRACPNW